MCHRSASNEGLLENSPDAHVLATDPNTTQFDTIFFAPLLFNLESSHMTSSLVHGCLDPNIFVWLSLRHQEKSWPPCARQLLFGRFSAVPRAVMAVAVVAKGP